MKRAVLCVLMALLCGCQSLPANPIRSDDQPVELTLAIPKGSSELVREVARELSRRAEDFAENSLSVEIVEAEDIPLAYHPGNTCRIKVKAAGDLA